MKKVQDEKMVYVCDGCGIEKMGVLYYEGGPICKPQDWFERSDEDGEQHACTRRCIEIVAAKTGKTRVVLPF